MKPLPPCLLFTRDPVLVRRLQAFLRSVAVLRAVDSVTALEEVLGRTPARVLLLDLQTDGVATALPEIAESWPRALVIALGRPASDPMIEAVSLGVYADEDREAPRLRLRALVERALTFIDLREELERVQQDAARAAQAARSAERLPVAMSAPLTARHFPGALRDFTNVDDLLQSLVEDVGASLLVSRAGIFCRARGQTGFRLRAGLRCLPDTRELAYAEGHPLAQWLALHAHVVTRPNLDHVIEPAEGRLLRETLDQLGAEVIVPLQAREQVLGWLFVGHRSTGLPYEMPQLENLILVADLVSTLLENALLYEEMTVQKTLAETLLHSMPTGIVAVAPDGVVRWFNQAAREMLPARAAEVLGRPVEALGSTLADLLRRALRREVLEQPKEWMDLITRRWLAVRTRALMHGDTCLGAVALLHDRTLERQMEEKQERVERAVFWAELAASMSHEIRNPLVAIRTFAQLLPERHEDAEFRDEFSTLVTAEVDRLNRIIDQINDFAHPPPLNFQPLDIRAPLRHALETVLPAGANPRIRVDFQSEPGLPSVWGDERALTDGFAHVLRNAVEALVSRDEGVIGLSARAIGSGAVGRFVEVCIRDNGPGMPPAMKEKAFSPFCTSKARGLGLGLPILKRTVVDHNGSVQIETDDQGTAITVTLPATGGPVE